MKKIQLLVMFFTVSVAVFAQHVQQPLTYSYNALEPYIDAQTMEIHYTKHHAAYVANLNKSLSGSGLESLSSGELQAKINADVPMAIRNNGGGHWNHDFFWSLLSPKHNLPVPEKLLKAIESEFGSFDLFKTAFKAAAMSRFGSGWAWLVVKDGKLVITSTPNQDNPLMPVAEVQGRPILGLDVWEHAYYLKYQNKRGDYVDAFFAVVDWNVVAGLYEKAK